MLDETAFVIDSRIDPTATVYRFARLDGAVLAARSEVGDGSRITRSTLGFDVKIDRNNHVHETVVGDFSYTGPNTVSMVSEIGKFCSISWNATIGPGDHDYRRGTTHAFLYNPKFSIGEAGGYDRFAAPCLVGHDVWIGCGAVVLRGVTVGHGAVIGANSVVTRSVPPYAVVAGSPARIIRYRFAEEHIAAFLDLAWWDWPREAIRASRDLLSAPPTEEIIEALRKRKTEIAQEDRH